MSLPSLDREVSNFHKTLHSSLYFFCQRIQEKPAMLLKIKHNILQFPNQKWLKLKFTSILHVDEANSGLKASQAKYLLVKK